MGHPRISPSYSLLTPSVQFIIESWLCLLEVVPFLHTQADPTVCKVHLFPPLSHCALLCANSQAPKAPNVNPACLPQFLRCFFGQNRGHHPGPSHHSAYRPDPTPSHRETGNGPMPLDSLTLVPWPCNICSSKACITQEPVAQKHLLSWPQFEAITSVSNLKFSNNVLGGLSQKCFMQKYLEIDILLLLFFQ